MGTANRPYCRACLAPRLSAGGSSRSGTSCHANARSVPDEPLTQQKWAEPVLRFERVVRPASELQVVHRRWAPISEWNHVVDFEAATLRATTGGAHERALASITPPHFPAYGSWNMPRVLLRGSRDAARTLRCRKASSFELLEQERQGALEDNRWIAVRDLMPHQVLDPSQLVVHLPAYGDLDFVSLRRERSNEAPR